MLKRIVAIVAGALTGAVLWFTVGAPVLGRTPAEVSTIGCMRDDNVECVHFDGAAPAPAVSSIADACKGWLSKGALASLSQCLHEARHAPNDDVAARLNALRRRQAVAASS